TEMASNAARAPDPIADGTHDARQVLGADDKQGNDRNDQQVGGINTKHFRALDVVGGYGSADQTSRLSSTRSAGDSSFFSSVRRRDAADSSSSAIPFLKLLIPFATSPIMSENRPLPNSNRTMMPTISQCQILKLTIATSSETWNIPSHHRSHFPVQSYPAPVRSDPDGTPP